MPNPANSPDIAPSDYGLIRSMVHFLKGLIFGDYEYIKIGYEEFLASKPKE